MRPARAIAGRHLLKSQVGSQMASWDQSGRIGSLAASHAAKGQAWMDIARGWNRTAVMNTFASAMAVNHVAGSLQTRAKVRRNDQVRI